jgi:hypothetical protein
MYTNLTLSPIWEANLKERPIKGWATGFLFPIRQIFARVRTISGPHSASYPVDTNIYSKSD